VALSPFGRLHETNAGRNTASDRFSRQRLIVPQTVSDVILQGKTIVSTVLTVLGSFEEQSQERRGHPRWDFVVPIFVRILVEENTFNPRRFQGHSRNISASGMLVEIHGVSGSDFKTFIRRPRMVRVHLQVSHPDNEVVFLGKIVWYEYRISSQGKACLLGIVFDRLPENEKRALAEILQCLESVAKVPQDHHSSGWFPECLSGQKKTQSGEKGVDSPPGSSGNRDLIQGVEIGAGSVRP